MPKIRKQLSGFDKTLLGNEIKPIKAKSKPKFHFCYVCREWFFDTLEDFLACGHYTLTRVEEQASKGPQYRQLFLKCLRPPEKAKPNEISQKVHH